MEDNFLIGWPTEFSRFFEILVGTCLWPDRKSNLLDRLLPNSQNNVFLPSSIELDKKNFKKNFHVSLDLNFLVECLLKNS